MIDLPVSRARPGDERGFIHKKLLRGVSKLAGVLPIPGASTISAITGALAGSRTTLPRTVTARVTQFSQAEKRLGAAVKFGGTEVQSQSLASRIPCIWPFRIDPVDGVCRLFAGDQGGPDDQPVGEAVMGQYGAGLVPGTRAISRAVCLRGMQLGNDGVCYNKSQISNKQRMWPAGRRPLLTGGDMRAISTAARAGRRLDLTTKRLQKLGMMKKPSAGGRRALPVHQHAKQIAAVSVT